MRKLKKILPYLLAAALIVSGSFLGSVYSRVSYPVFKSEREIYADAASLGADMSYLLSPRRLNRKTVRLAHNKNAPVKVVLSGKLTDKLKEAVRRTYAERINPLMRHINPDYIFLPVDERDFKKTCADKVVIYVKSMRGEEMWSPLGETYWYSHDTFFTSAITAPTVYLDEYLNDSFTKPEYVTVHEILHTLGFADVYGREDEVDTLLSDYNSFSLDSYFLTPNDVKVLAALYCRDMQTFIPFLAEYTAEYERLLAEFTERNRTEALLPL